MAEAKSQRTLLEESVVKDSFTTDAEAKRLPDKKHVEKVNDRIAECFSGVAPSASFDEICDLVKAIRAGKIDHLKIEY